MRNTDNSAANRYIKRQVQKGMNPLFNDELENILDNKEDKSLNRFNDDYDKIKK